MPAQWLAVSTAIKEGRYELVLSGKETSDLLTKHGFDDRIYNLQKLNFLEISHTCLNNLSEAVSNLSHLTQLNLSFNLLTTLPTSLSEVTSLRFLDVSYNGITCLPDNIFHKLTNLTSLNLSGNALEYIPTVESLKLLTKFTADKNKLKALPDGIQMLSNLVNLSVCHNELTELPDELNFLTSLRVADFSENSLTTLPSSLHRCRKLTSLLAQDNNFKDPRLRKIVNSGQISALMNYLSKQDNSKGKHDKGHGKIMKSENDDQQLNSFDSMKPHIVIMSPNESENYFVSKQSNVKNSCRPYLVVCTIHGVYLNNETILRSFLRAQEEWHHDAGGMRWKATLATHDLKMVKFPLKFSIAKAHSFQFHPLNRLRSMTGEAFIRQLYTEANQDRKTRKKTQFSQVYRYLNLFNLDRASADTNFGEIPIPIITDAQDTIISVPPLTNCHETRLNLQTRDILLEVTGRNLATCKQIAEEVIGWLLTNCLLTSSTPSNDIDKLTEKMKTSTCSSMLVKSGSLLVRPVRVVDADSGGVLVFPSHIDLVDSKFNTVHN